MQHLRRTKSRTTPSASTLRFRATGTVKPAGVLATSSYKATDPGVLYNLDVAPPVPPYTIPGPPVYSGSVTVSQTKMSKATATWAGVRALNSRSAQVTGAKFRR